MRNVALILLLILKVSSLTAQSPIKGIVTDAQTGKPLSGASVKIAGSNTGIATNTDGYFELISFPVNSILQISYVGYRDEMVPSVSFQDSDTLFIKLLPTAVSAPVIEIAATRFGAAAVMAATELDKNDIAKNNTGKDLPFLMTSVPSLVATSDAGNGVGYTGVRIRGSDASRINVTIDGIPINDAESQLLYWVNMPDIASSVESVHIQRGAGTSTNGAGAFGGSIHIQSALPADSTFVSSSNSIGSFVTLKNNIIFGSGWLKNKWNFEGRLSKIKSEGYVDRAAADLKSFYFSANYRAKNNLIRFKTFSGKEVTYQSWYGIPEAALDTNRTFNYYSYANQVDNYQQDHYQLLYSGNLLQDVTINAALHYTYGRGFYEEFIEEASFSDYQLIDPVIGNDTITFTDLVRRKWLRNDFYGATWSVKYDAGTNTSLLAGGAYNMYDGDHFGEVIWAQFASNGKLPHRYYFNNGKKGDFNAYLKATTVVGEKLTVFGDVQLRRIDYRFEGPDDTGKPAPRNEKLIFFNPKAGINYAFSQQSEAYLSFSVANKEPSRDDYTESTTGSRPDPERLYDFEAGFRVNEKQFSAGINSFLMWYENQLVLTGKINDVGNYTRTNIASSYRRGVEVEGSWKPVDQLQFNGNFSVSENKISRYYEYIDDYDNGGQVIAAYDNTDIAFSPQLVAFAEITWKANRNLEFGVVNKYVGKQFLDNTSNASRAIDAYYLTDLRVDVTLKPKFMKKITVGGVVSNLFNHEYESNGYTFSYVSGGEKITGNYYYPQAGINYMIRLNLEF